MMGALMGFPPKVGTGVPFFGEGSGDLSVENDVD